MVARRSLCVIVYRMSFVVCHFIRIQAQKVFVSCIDSLSGSWNRFNHIINRQCTIFSLDILNIYFTITSTSIYHYLYHHPLSLHSLLHINELVKQTELFFARKDLMSYVIMFITLFISVISCNKSHLAPRKPE